MLFTLPAPRLIVIIPPNDCISLVLTIYANNNAGTTVIEDGYYILDSASNNTMSLKLKGKGTVSFLFVPGRL